MIYPQNFEPKIGFDQIRQLLSEKCLSTLGAERVADMTFSDHFEEVDKSGFLTFGRVARSIQTHYLNIINFFERRATNAAAESFNAKIKAFRAQFRGVKDKAFFLYRLAKLYA